MPEPDDRQEANRQVMDTLVLVSFNVIASLTRVAAAHDLSLTQLRLMAILRDREPGMAELADYLGLERSSVSGLIDRAVARGLVRRAASRDDGRAVRVRLTAEGRRMAAVGAQEASALLLPMLGELSPGEQARLGVLLGAVLAGDPAANAG
jgi:DNA-binding MarR family transcriptional regulator